MSTPVDRYRFCFVFVPCVTDKKLVHSVLKETNHAFYFHFSPKDMGLLDPATSDGRVIFFLPWEGEMYKSY